MKRTTKRIAACGLALAGAIAAAQAQDPAPGGGRAGADAAPANDLVTRMLAFDKDKDGALKKSEITDSRLVRLFESADADKDGTVTKEELTAYAAKQVLPERFDGFNGPGGPRGPGGPGGRWPRPG